MFYYIYILESEAEKSQWYVGYTKDLKNRLEEHNRGESKSTRRYRPWKLIYYEACRDEGDAKRREKYLKTSQGRRMLKIRLKGYVRQ